MKRKNIQLLDTTIDAYVACSGAFYPNMNISLKIFATDPVATVTVGRTFSIRKLLKTYVRSIISETRLNDCIFIEI